MSDTNNEIAEPLINSVVPELVEDANVDYTSTITLPEVGKKVIKDADARGKLAEVITSTNKAIEEVIKLQGTAEQLLAQDSVLANVEIDLRDGQQALAESITTILNNQKTLAEAILEGGSGSGGTVEPPEWFNAEDPMNSGVPDDVLTSNGIYILGGSGTLGDIWTATEDWSTVKYVNTYMTSVHNSSDDVDMLAPVVVFSGLAIPPFTH